MKFRFTLSFPASSSAAKARAREARPDLIRALLVAPSRNLSKQLRSSLAEVPNVEVVQQFDSYPSFDGLANPVQTLRANIVFLDLATDLDTACGLIRSLASRCPDVHVVGLDQHRCAETVMRALRVGATEFLIAPVPVAELQEALARIDRLRHGGTESAHSRGRVIAFASAKPGAGATTLAAQMALALRTATGRRILLLDFDLQGGLVGAGLATQARYSVLDAMERADSLDAAAWTEITEKAGDIEVLTAPRFPCDGDLDPGKLHTLLSSARQTYDWIVLDLPLVFRRQSLLAMAESDLGFVVTTTEFASLHLARRAADWLGGHGFGADRFQILANRAVFSNSLDRRSISDVLESDVAEAIPNDYRSLHQLARFGEMPGADTELGATLRRFAARLVGPRSPASGPLSLRYDLRPAVAR